MLTSIFPPSEQKKRITGLEQSRLVHRLPVDRSWVSWETTGRYPPGDHRMISHELVTSCDRGKTRQ